MKRLKKSPNKVIAGVCGGLAEYMNPELDPIVIRSMWAIVTFFLPPVMIILYIVLAIVLPDKYSY